MTGKGGVGKTTLSSVLSYLYAKEGKKVIAVDADPDANLATALGFTDSEIQGMRPIAEMAELIAERTGAHPGAMGGVFKLNPKVDDIPEACSRTTAEGIRLLIMGKLREASTGCYCPENVFLKRLLKHLVVERGDVVIVDMEAGIEHLTRGTAEGVDAFIVVVEPGKRSIQTALSVRDMAKGLGISQVYVVAGKVRNEADIEFIQKHIEGMELIGSVRFTDEIANADMQGTAVFKSAPSALKDIAAIKNVLDSKVSEAVKH
ncbi:ATP-binding protein [Candidatus Magnetomonas plexicatena]|uniref:ATP-binding protein n=1 Tax=Candidatus Magnetomonas plexicatena TaxID=2552947 RepID=UPI004032A4F4